MMDSQINIDTGKGWGDSVAALVLAAGMSTRMGQAKMVLPWGNTTIIGQVIRVLKSSGLVKIVVVTGAGRQQVVEVLENTDVEIVHNPMYSNGEMLHSFQLGLSRLSSQLDAVLVALGDQPLIRSEVVCALLQEYLNTRAAIVVPSINNRRGHPWILDRRMWSNVGRLRSPETLRDFLNSHADEIHYLKVDDSSILVDIDTPEQYRKLHDEHSSG